MNLGDLAPWAAAAAAVLLVLGGLLTVVGALGLLRLRSFFERMHSPTLGTTLGVGCVLLASMLVSSNLAARPVIHELAIGVFIMLTSPISAMTLMRAGAVRAGLDSARQVRTKRQ